ncbi:MAG: alpha-2-macroglobulin family protein, partial [Pseudomonadota bacterium]
RIRFETLTAGAAQFDYDLSTSASRGAWRAVAEIDGVGTVGSASFAVEDFVPQRIKVDLDVDVATPILAGQSRDLEVETRFLYGAPGAGLTVQSQARIEVDPAPFPKFKDFKFGRHDRSFAGQIVELPDQAADGAGKAVLNLEPRGRGADADKPLRINAVVSVLEPGGRAVTDSARIPYRPRGGYLGIQRAAAEADANSAQGFDVAFVGAADGEARAAEFNWKVVAIDYHYDWYRDSQGRWRWRRSRSVTTKNEGVASAPAGGVASVSIDGLDFGDHQLIVEGPNNSQASYSFWVGWGGGLRDDGVEAPDRVTVKAPEGATRKGRNAEISIVAPYDGQAQIVVATDRVLSVRSQPVSKDGTRVSLPVTEEWGEGAYVMVNVYRSRDPVLRAKPRRAVGVAYVPVDMGERTFDVAISAPEVVRPRQTETITVEIEGGSNEQAYLTLAAVDEGILQLTKFKNPDPRAYFFGKKALGVSLHDDYGRLLDPNLGFPAEVRSGGDQLGGEGLSVVPTKTVALFTGVVEAPRTGKAQIPIELPDFNGELRLMAVVWSDNAVGSAAQAMTVRDQVPAELILPRFMAPGDQALATVSIDNVEGQAGLYEASLSTDGPVSAEGSATVARSLEPGQRADQPLGVSS